MIKEQFIERDLFNATDISQIQWRIKGNKLSKEKVLEYLSSKEGREMLDNKKIIRLFDDYAEKIKHSKEITNTNDILELLKSNENWYNLIFK